MMRGGDALWSGMMMRTTWYGSAARSGLAGVLLIVAAPSAFTLAAAGATMAQRDEAPPAATPPAERRICKRSAPSGSLIETRRECHTRAEWDQIAQAGRAAGQDMVERAARSGAQ
ncbi:MULTISPECIES: hypothetical protein [unclassified Sphingomonas]|uniref:hypothetical protein n=1 Tax=unclassified Sphingomonas TaxID=196159 RepID=UPI0006FBC0C7|nr:MULTISPECIES: hypothetical protein [unclassified Sphingomonas]KQN14133.1 hypothetical protein ASE89_10345 [Sphingomonas sp. Leaf30]MBD8550843.1 hypothetical protein [Sphingomonas sp. CFBP 8764]